MHCEVCQLDLRKDERIIDLPGLHRHSDMSTCVNRLQEELKRQEVEVPQ